MADDSVYADLLDALSPLKTAGVDPDQARIDPQAAMAKLNGPAPETPWWQPQEQTAAPAQPGASPASVSPNGTPKQTFQPATPPGAPKPPVAGAPSWESYQRRNVEGSLNSLDQGDQDLAKMRAQPDINAVTAPLQAQRAKDAVPINPYDPQTGKPVAQYAPNFATRFMRGIEGFARGGVLGAVDPAMTGSSAYGAPNAQYGRDLAMQTGRLASDDNQLAQAKANWTAANDRLKAQADATRAQAAERKGLATEITGQESIPIHQQEADAHTATAYNESPEGKAATATKVDAATHSDRMAQIADKSNPISKASRADQAYFVAYGRLPEPDRYHAPEEVIAGQQALNAFKAEHGRLPKTIDEYQQVREAAKGDKEGSPMMVPDGKGGMTMQTVKPGDTVPQGATTVAGMAASSKTAGKAQEAAQSIVDEADTAHELAREAESGNAPADVDLALAFFKMMKGSAGSGIRFTQSEQNLIMGARNSAGDIEGVAQKVIGGGQKFTPDQREKILRVIDIHAAQAKKHLQDSEGNAAAPSGGSFNWNDHPAVE